MCFITASTAAAISAVASVAGAGITALGAINQGNAAGDAAAFQAQVARNNAAIAEQDARRQEVVAAQQAQNKSLESAARLSRVKAAQAASGVDVNTGSAVDVQAGTRMLGQLDAETVLSNEMLKAYGYRSRASSFLAQSALDEARGSYSRAAGYTRAAGTLLSSVSSLPLKWLGGGGGGSVTSSVDSVPGPDAWAMGNNAIGWS